MRYLPRWDLQDLWEWAGCGLLEGGKKHCFHLHDHDNTCSMYLIISWASEDLGELACRNLVSDWDLD